MSSVPSTPVPGKRSELVEKALIISLLTKGAKNHLFWCSVNVVLLSLTFYYLSKSPSSKSGFTIQNILQLLFTCLFAINCLFHLYSYLKKTISVPVISVSPTQRKLMGIRNSDINFIESTQPELSKILPVQAEFTSTTPMNLSSSSWLSQSLLNTSSNSVSQNDSLYSSPVIQRTQNTSSDELITNKQTLERYLNTIEDVQKKSAISENYQQTATNMLTSFWNSNSNRNIFKVSPMLNRCSYQLASPTPVTPVLSGNSGGVVNDENISPTTLQLHQDVWGKLKIDPSLLTQWNANLRMWISLTVLQRLVKEFQVVDDLFQRCGLSDMMIGSVGLERLKKTAQNHQIVANIPSLPRLVNYLDLTPHQEYLVTRIKELAKGGGMSEYRWNSGGTINGKNWEEHLPTDASLVMHMIATYLDSQLLHTDGRPFSSQYLFKSPEKPQSGRNGLILYQSQLNPPHFVLLENEHCLEVAKGRNNLFHTFLFFLHLLKTREHEMLGRVNLGPSGINILWVIET